MKKTIFAVVLLGTMVTSGGARAQNPTTASTNPTFVSGPGNYAWNQWDRVFSKKGWKEEEFLDTVAALSGLKNTDWTWRHIPEGTVLKLPGVVNAAAVVDPKDPQLEARIRELEGLNKGLQDKLAKLGAVAPTPVTPALSDDVARENRILKAVVWLLAVFAIGSILMLVWMWRRNRSKVEDAVDEALTKARREWEAEAEAKKTAAEVYAETHGIYVRLPEEFRSTVDKSEYVFLPFVQDAKEDTVNLRRRPDPVMVKNLKRTLFELTPDELYANGIERVNPDPVTRPDHAPVVPTTSTLSSARA